MEHAVQHQFIFEKGKIQMSLDLVPAGAPCSRFGIGAARKQITLLYAPPLNLIHNSLAESIP